MPTRLLIVLLLIVVLPLALLTGLGLRLMSSERQAVEHRLQTLIDGQLQSVDQIVQDYFSRLARTLSGVAADLPIETQALRRYARRTPPLRQLFVISADGNRLHPPADALLNADERRFLQRSEAIWREKDILYQSTAEQTARGDWGWYVWYWGNETNLIFWQRDRLNNLIGFELDPVRLTAELINLLPATGDAADLLGDARLQLSDSRGSVVYQWGVYQPGEDQPALRSRPLSHPLASWQLAYYAAELGVTRAQRHWLMLAVLIAVAAVLAGLAYYLYREHRRTVRLAQQRVNFVNQVSHELKTPLTNIRMYAELLEDQLPDAEEKTQRYLAIIVSESQRLSRLIGNVLNFAGLQNKRLQLQRRPGRIDDVVEQALATFRPALQSKGVTITLHADAAAPVSVDPDMLEQILNNLLSNVEKYAGGVRLEIITWQQADYSYIRIRDHGPGIARRERQRIFQPFYRISSKLSDGVSGTGIGLTITRELARLHGGELELLPDDGARGACFQVTLQTPAVARQPG